MQAARNHEVTVRQPVYQVDHGERGRHHQAASEERGGAGAVNRPIYGVSKLRHAFFAKQAGKERQ